MARQQETGEYWNRSDTVELGYTAEAKSRLGSVPWYSSSRDFDLPPGSYQAKMAIRHKKSGRLGTVTHEFVVPGLSPWRVSSLVLMDALTAKPAGERPTQPKLLARRTFGPTGRSSAVSRFMARRRMRTRICPT